MMEKSGRVSTAALVHCFFNEVDRAFGPWLVAGRGTLTRDLTHANRSGFLEATTPEQIQGFFSAVVDFETPGMHGALTFGDREYCIDTLATPNGRLERYALWEWADAVDRAELVPLDTAFILQLERMTEIVQALAWAARELENIITEAPPRILQRMLAARLARQTAWEAEMRNDKHRGYDGFDRAQAILLSSVTARPARLGR